jgi:hypothetical protein
MKISIGMLRQTNNPEMTVLSFGFFSTESRKPLKRLYKSPSKFVCLAGEPSDIAERTACFERVFRVTLRPRLQDFCL